MRTTLVLGICLLTLGCSDDAGGGGLGDVAAELEGIYQVDTHTLNEGGCDAEGADVTGDTHLLARSQSVFGQTLLNFFSCSDVADCRANSASFDAGESFAFGFSFAFGRVDGNGTLQGQVRGTGFSGGDGTCTDGGVEDQTLARSGDDIRIESRGRFADFPEDNDGFCTTDAAEQAVQGLPCAQLEVVTATFVEAL